jgi:genome maintenance exonuclease 1
MQSKTPKNFRQNRITLPDIYSTTDKETGKRVYTTPTGEKYPSITTILSGTKKDTIKAWRERVGADEANKITRAAASRGTSLHAIVEDYINNKPIENKGSNITGFVHFKTIQHEVDMIDNILLQETGVWSDFWRIAGKLDCLAQYRGILSIIDFKTSRKPKPRAWIENYFIQGAFYAAAVKERTKGIICPKQTVIIMANDDQTFETYIEPVDVWYEKLEVIRDEYEKVA